MPEAWLTIDDTPSAMTDGCVNYLLENDIPALFFCRGDRLSENPEPACRAIEKGFAVGNHAWSHRRASAMGYAETVNEIASTERLIEDCYRAAGVERARKYFRFPHIDRGAGGWVVDYDAHPEHRDTLVRLFSDGLNIDLAPPDPGQVETKLKLQEYLRAEGYGWNFPVTFPWYAGTEMGRAADAMFTFSSSDWMLTARHRGRHKWKSVPDLKARMAADPFLWREDSPHILLMHDQDDLAEVFTELMDYLLTRGFRFKTFS